MIRKFILELLEVLVCWAYKFITSPKLIITVLLTGVLTHFL